MILCLIVVFATASSGLSVPSSNKFSDLEYCGPGQARSAINCAAVLVEMSTVLLAARPPPHFPWDRLVLITNGYSAILGNNTNFVRSFCLTPLYLSLPVVPALL